MIVGRELGRRRCRNVPGRWFCWIIISLRKSSSLHFDIIIEEKKGATASVEAGACKIRLMQGKALKRLPHQMAVEMTAQLLASIKVPSGLTFPEQVRILSAI
jgi:hypothetical protein